MNAMFEKDLIKIGNGEKNSSAKLILTDNLQSTQTYDSVNFRVKSSFRWILCWEWVKRGL